MTRLARYAWMVLGVTILVILWGALVRATGSGAGCGNHWPTCNGVVLPRTGQTATLIEFGHRLTSALAGLLVLILLVWTWRETDRGQPVRAGAAWSFLFILVEGALGAMLVRLELVGDNASIARAAVVALHLANTFLLLGWLALTAWWASGGPAVAWHPRGTWLLAGLAGLLLVGAAGAVTALGDTLFPAASLAAGLHDDRSPAAHFLVRLRVWHPVLAVAVSLYWLALGARFRRAADAARIQSPIRLMSLLILVQLAAGVLNVLLLVPVWLQLVHLLLADLLWVTVVVLAAAILARPAGQSRSAPATPRTAPRAAGSLASGRQPDL